MLLLLLLLLLPLRLRLLLLLLLRRRRRLLLLLYHYDYRIYSYYYPLLAFFQSDWLIKRRDTDLGSSTSAPRSGERATVCETVTAVGVGIGEAGRAGARRVSSFPFCVEG